MKISGDELFEGVSSAQLPLANTTGVVVYENRIRLVAFDGANKVQSFVGGAVTPDDRVTSTFTVGADQLMALARACRGKDVDVRVQGSRLEVESATFKSSIPTDAGVIDVSLVEVPAGLAINVSGSDLHLWIRQLVWMLDDGESANLAGLHVRSNSGKLEFSAANAYSVCVVTTGASSGEAVTSPFRLSGSSVRILDRFKALDSVSVCRVGQKFVVKNTTGAGTIDSVEIPIVTTKAIDFTPVVSSVLMGSTDEVVVNRQELSGSLSDLNSIVQVGKGSAFTKDFGCKVHVDSFGRLEISASTRSTSAEVSVNFDGADTQERDLFINSFVWNDAVKSIQGDELTLYLPEAVTDTSNAVPLGIVGKQNGTTVTYILQQRREV